MTKEKKFAYQKETFGKKLLDANLKNEGKTEKLYDIMYGVGENHQKKIENILSENANVSGIYYIQVIYRDEAFDERCKRLTYVVRRSRPYPAWQTMLYKVDNTTNKATIEYALPKKQDAQEMITNVENVDCDTLKWINLMMDKKLV